VTKENLAAKAVERKKIASERLTPRPTRVSVLEAFERLLETNGGRLTMPAREILDVLAAPLERRCHKLSFQLAVARGEAEGRIRVDRTGRPNTYWLNTK
jgi:hypothetical protein